MTTKLYDLSPYETVFESEVLEVRSLPTGYGVILAATLFFPEGGGQSADRGTLGGLPVLDVKIDKAGVITHILPAALPVGEKAVGEIDFRDRYRKMQNHTGEHIFSGTLAVLYGMKNVGFHLGDSEVTVDFDAPLPNDDYTVAEKLANDAVYRNIPVECRYPSADELKNMTYRSKIDLTENVRIVKIGDVDTCACCAPHVAATGEVGMIKVTSYMHYKGGCRMTLLCGADALADYEKRIEAARAISRLLSVPEAAIDSGVSRLLAETNDLRAALAEMRREKAEKMLADAAPTDGNLVFYLPTFDASLLQNLAVHGAAKAGKLSVAYAPDAKGGYSFVISSEHLPLRAVLPDILTALSGRGGGNDACVRGSFAAEKEKIEEFFRNY